MQVKDVMSHMVVDVQPETSIFDAVQLMLAQGVSAVPVLDRSGDLVGILSEGDLLRRVELGTTREDHWYSHFFTPGGTADAYIASHTKRVGDIMSKSPVTTTPTALLTNAVTLMEKHRVKRLPVVDQGRIVGIVSRSDFLRALASVLAAPSEKAAASDADIERTIVAELQEQDWAANTSIRPTVFDGHVTLLGSIIAENQRTAAHVLAGNVRGVRSVSDDLVLRDSVTLMSF